MKLHRLATIPPSGCPTGKRQVLCGHYLREGRYTTVPEDVTCGVCQRAATSARTIEQDRLALS